MQSTKILGWCGRVATANHYPWCAKPSLQVRRLEQAPGEQRPFRKDEQITHYVGPLKALRYKETPARPDIAV
jgi:hypothetical protein